MDAEDTQVMTRTGEFTSTTLGWEASVRGRVAAAVDRLSGPLADLLERDANDGDTRMLVADFFSFGLNFSKYQDMTTEYRTSGDSIDYAIMLEGKLFAPVEVRRVGQGLDQRNIQVSRRLAVEEGAEWVILTNGRLWKVYHLRPDGDGGNRPVEVIDADLMDADAYQRNIDALFHITREAVDHGRLDTLRRWKEAVEAAPVAEVLRSDAVVETVRAQLRAATGHQGHAGDADEVRRALVEEVISQGLLEG
jgi:predicted type IV restriction endonuclease